MHLPQQLPSGGCGPPFQLVMVTGGKALWQPRSLALGGLGFLCVPHPTGPTPPGPEAGPLQCRPLPHGETDGLGSEPQVTGRPRGCCARARTDLRGQGRDSSHRSLCGLEMGSERQTTWGWGQAPSGCRASPRAGPSFLPGVGGKMKSLTANVSHHRAVWCIFWAPGTPPRAKRGGRLWKHCQPPL